MTRKDVQILIRMRNRFWNLFELHDQLSEETKAILDHDGVPWFNSIDGFNQSLFIAEQAAKRFLDSLKN